MAMPAGWQRMALRLALISSLISFANTVVQAQDHGSNLSDAEIDKLRDLAQAPPERLMAFISFINQRVDGVEKLTTGKRNPGRGRRYS